MQWHESVPTDDFPQLDAVTLWGVAILFFGIGDVVTTIIGLQLAGVVEMHPIAVWTFQFSTLGAMVFLKCVAFTGCYALWKLTPRPHCVGVPLGLAAFGVLVTAWNLHILLRSIVA